MTCRGIRGAITVEANTTEAILAATQSLLQEMTVANSLRAKDVASIIFTATPDLDAVYPARAVRDLGWVSTPLLCMQEMAVENSLNLCIRILIHWNTDLGPDEIRHIYLGGAQVLRPDLAKEREK
jgi:chorismate mutase